MSQPAQAERLAALTDSIAVAMGKLVDDARGQTREPSHSDLAFQIQRAGLRDVDPFEDGQRVGKAKRVRSVLTWAIEHDLPSGEALVRQLVGLVRGCGGFRPESKNYVGPDVVETLRVSFVGEGFELTETGDLLPIVLESLSGRQLTNALRAYIRRAKRGVADAALLSGTGKDLMEAVAAHVLVERFGEYSDQANFPTLLGQAFVALGLTTPANSFTPGEAPKRRLERSLFEAACAVNRLRNKEGTGHGRPWLVSVSDAEARTAVELIGVVAERLLDAHEGFP